MEQEHLLSIRFIPLVEWFVVGLISLPAEFGAQLAHVTHPQALTLRSGVSQICWRAGVPAAGRGRSWFHLYQMASLLTRVGGHMVGCERRIKNDFPPSRQMSVVLCSKAAAIRCIIEALHEASVPTCSQGGFISFNGVKVWQP